jgi:hydrogenase expression/formation protein HypE
MDTREILLAHGSGGKATHQLIEEVFLPPLTNNFLEELNDSARLPINGGKILFTTDSYVVDPPFFPGGNIGTLAVNGTINDLAVCGGKPLYLSLAFILEEGFSLEHLRMIIQSITAAAKEANVSIVTGDTKVVGRGGADKIFINTAGIASLDATVCLSLTNVRPGDQIIINGSIGDHGIAVMMEREGLDLSSDIKSDTAALHLMIAEMMKITNAIRFMRDPTRGGIATTLNEITLNSGFGIVIYEDKIPVKPAVNAASEILGLDPLYIANEGKLIAIVDQDKTDEILHIMQKNHYGKEAAVIGHVTADLPGKVVLRTKVGGSRIVDMLTGEQLPRIC